MIWNFAYGSNLDPGKLRARADVTPLRVERAVLHDWRLAFNLATGLFSCAEPSMANLVPAPGDAVHGVAIALTPADFDAVVGSEGGALFYRLAVFDVVTYAGEELEARAFVAMDDVVRDEVPPSQRYLDLIRAGARQQDLDADYQAHLQTYAAAPPSSASVWMPRLLAALEHPRARVLRDLFFQGARAAARAQARRARARVERR